MHNLNRSEREVVRGASFASVRIRPDDWLHPLPLEHYFSEPNKPLEVDIGCGKGRFLLARSAAHPETNFLGIDRMLRRICKLDRKIVRLGQTNVRLLRMEAYYAVTYLLPAESVNIFYIWFPDPWPKKRHEEHRLFNPRFMNALHRSLKQGGAMHFATDHQPYYETVRSLFQADARFKETAPYLPTEEEQTDFERWYVRQGPVWRLSVIKK